MSKMIAPVSKCLSAGTGVCLLLLILAGCQPVRELRSPCHVAAAAAGTGGDCDFTPINRGAV